VTANPDTRLRIAVVGAGSVGCHLGGHLSAAADVMLIGRERVISAVQAEGLTLTGGGKPTVHVPAEDLRLATDTSAVAGADVVLVTTKSLATRTVAREVSPQLTRRTVVISIQNGLRNATVIREALTDSFPDSASRPVVLTGMIGYNIVHTDAATFHQGTSGEILVQDHPAARPFIATATAAKLPVAARDDMREVQYAKLLMNLNNAINALSGLPLRDELQDRDFRRCLALCQDEALAVLQAENVRPARLTPLPAQLTPRLLRAPDPVFRALAAQTLKVDPHARSSMAEDFDLGRPSEIDELQGAVVALGEEHGVSTPACRRVVELVRGAEAAGSGRRTWSGAELLGELEAARALSD
jgi:2-dehydropantoate 2-reductase